MVATSSGTSALHLALISVGVMPGDEVITQPLTFVATCNAISYCGAEPVFVDISRKTLGMSPESLKNFLEKYGEVRHGTCYNRYTGRRISACVPVHVFGHPCEIDKIVEICAQYNIKVVEDSAEALGSFYKGKHVGTFGEAGIISFNGNKIITTGGGGAILTNNKEIELLAKHLSTTAKVPSDYEYIHDRVGYNYRMPNINAALGVAQMKKLKLLLEKKRRLADKYRNFFAGLEIAKFVDEPPHSSSNFWLNSIIFTDKDTRDMFLKMSNEEGIMTRPAWKLMTSLPMYRKCQKTDIKTADFIQSRLVAIPSWVKC